jgi:hypothetical protein
MLAGSRRFALLLALLGWWSSAGVVRGAPADVYNVFVAFSP